MAWSIRASAFLTWKYNERVDDEYECVIISQIKKSILRTNYSVRENTAILAVQQQQTTYLLFVFIALFQNNTMFVNSVKIPSVRVMVNLVCHTHPTTLVAELQDASARPYPHRQRAREKKEDIRQRTQVQLDLICLLEDKVYNYETEELKKTHAAKTDCS